MLGIKTSWYYRLCWSIVTPAVMTAILLYTLVEYKPLEYNGYTYLPGVYSKLPFVLISIQIISNMIFVSFQFSVGVYPPLA